ncbi:MFS transporter [Aminobacter sp. MSH1]|uniref:MFS transporter n=1 Tax=Aminobacter sp. MSH1 TaxID=374606 RepID=UPI000D3C3EE5|nr:MFS transporter [Aminobacter sp. MSH1]
MGLPSLFPSRALAWLWTGQAAAAVGAEFYSVALIWTAADILGTAAGYVPAIHAGVILAGALVSGAFVDRWRRGSAMLMADAMRATAVAVVALAYSAGMLSGRALVAAAALVALATAIFDPALQASIPALVSDASARHRVNCLFDATKRMARILAPAAIALVASVVSKGMFFVVTGLAFLASIATTIRVRAELDRDHAEPAVVSLPSLARSLVAGMLAVRGRPIVAAALVGLIVSNFTWAAGMLLGMALYLRDTSSTPLGDFSLIMAAYGVGNLATTLCLSGREPKNPMYWLILSKLTFGLGICALPFAGNLPMAMALAAFAAINGPLENLTVLYLVQSQFEVERVAAVFRLVLCATYGGLFLAYVASPSLFTSFGLRPVIVAAGALSLGAGGVGVLLLGARRSAA